MNPTLLRQDRLLLRLRAHHTTNPHADCPTVQDHADTLGIPKRTVERDLHDFTKAGWMHTHRRGPRSALRPLRLSVDLIRQRLRDRFDSTPSKLAKSAVPLPFPPRTREAGYVPFHPRPHEHDPPDPMTRRRQPKPQRPEPAAPYIELASAYADAIAAEGKTLHNRVGFVGFVAACLADLPHKPHDGRCGHQRMRELQVDYGLTIPTRWTTPPNPLYSDTPT